MAQLSHYYTLCWTSRSGVNVGAEGGLSRPRFPSGATVKPWLLLSLTQFTLLMCCASSHTHILPPPPSLPSSRQRRGMVSHGTASSCVTGAMWGWGGESVVRGGGLLCVVTSPLPFIILLQWLSMKEAICLLPLICGCESVSDTVYLELVIHPPTSSFTRRIRSCWQPLLDHVWLFLFCDSQDLLNCSKTR